MDVGVVDGDDGEWRDKARGVPEGEARGWDEGGLRKEKEEEEKKEGQEVRRVARCGRGGGCGTVDRCVARVSSGSRALAL